MMRQHSGLVVMIGSVVSWLASPFGAAYSGGWAGSISLVGRGGGGLKPASSGWHRPPGLPTLVGGSRLRWVVGKCLSGRKGSWKALLEPRHHAS